MDQTEIRDVNTLFMQCMGHDSPPYHMLISIPILGAVKNVSFIHLHWKSYFTVPRVKRCCLVLCTAHTVRKANRTLTLLLFNISYMIYYIQGYRHIKSKRKRLATRRDHWNCRRETWGCFVSNVSSFSSNKHKYAAWSAL